MSRSLADLDPRFAPLAAALIDRAEAAAIPLVVVETRRTEAEHLANVKAGKSWTRHSKHIDGLAIDVCPKALISTPGWMPDSPLWDKLGEIGEALGLRWGGRWKQRDMVHFEYVAPPTPPTEAT